ncbi:MAG: M48 family metallopeptidase [Candidatus Taylorbacteria bacterium]|nr:M48 family metallopeptidase [Candidatus Taylorbacteria bacterium]
MRRGKREERQEYLKNRENARAFIERKSEEFNKFYGYKINRISIRNQRTRWGSCSKKGNLNFNYRLILLPERLADYVIVHEICHLGEFNHSSKFWALVERTIPDYRERRQILKKIRTNML